MTKEQYSLTLKYNIHGVSLIIEKCSGLTAGVGLSGKSAEEFIQNFVNIPEVERQQYLHETYLNSSVCWV